VGKFNYDQVIAYALIGFNNWNHSANKRNRRLNNFEMFMKPLEDIHEKENVVKYAEMLKENENKKKNKKDT